MFNVRLDNIPHFVRDQSGNVLCVRMLSLSFRALLGTAQDQLRKKSVFACLKLYSW